MDTTQLLKGVLDVAVLAAIKDEDGYGFDIVRRLRDAGIRCSPTYILCPGSQVWPGISSFAQTPPYGP